MTTGHHDDSLGEGVYYAPEDYVGIMWRLVILIIDAAVLILLYFALAYVFFTMGSDWTETSWLVGYWCTYVVMLWFYLAVLKPSKVRTVGYWLTRSQIVDLKGNQPSILRMTFRVVLWLFGPFNFLYDLVWAGADEDKRTLRDCFAGTCVIRFRAVPIGTGTVRLAYYNALALTLMYPRVMRLKEYDYAHRVRPDASVDGQSPLPGSRENP